MKLAFASCMDAERLPHQPVWDEVARHQPDALLLLGDQIYMDWGLAGHDWRGAIARRPEEGLRAFAEDMHRRYALQWGVPQFQRLVTSLKDRPDKSRLLVTWDDHDFAWNNALGVDGVGQAYRHGVPQTVKSVSRRLFEQFVTQLRTAVAGADYPPLPPDWRAPWPADQDGNLYWQGRLCGNGPELILLDTRWERQARAANANLLGRQRGSLLNALAQPSSGLLIVAAGTPMVYRYLVSQQDWRGNDHEPGYEDYALATAAARARPVLMLSGDVHRNVFSGRLGLADGKGRCRIVQVISSGAAIGRFGPKRFAPSFGLLNVDGDGRTDGSIDLQLWAQKAEGAWEQSPKVGRLAFTRDDWAGALEGEALSDEPAQPDCQTLSVLAARSRTSGHRGNDDVSGLPELDALDTVFANVALQSLDGEDSGSPISAQSPPPEPVELRWHQASEAVSANFSLRGSVSQLNRRVDSIDKLLHDAFERALDAKDKRSVVLFIHGFGKTFAASVDQAYALRAAYAQCEPILYSWASGRAGGVLASLFGVSDALKSAKAGASGLAGVLAAFGRLANDPRHKQLTKVVLARSAGSVALHEALLTLPGPGDGRAMDGVTRIVLSAPLLKLAAFRDIGSFGGCSLPVVVTRNRNDRSLKLADWVDGFGPIVGCEGEFVTPKPNAWCLDFTNSPRIGRLHDYLLPDINPAQRELHRRLLIEPQFDPVALMRSNTLLLAQSGACFDVA